MAGASFTTKAKIKKVRTACRSCGKARKFLNMDSTFCCKNWICDDYIDYGKIVCHYNHRKYSCCSLHFNERHEGKWQDCEECVKMGDSKYDFDEVTCFSCGFKSQSMADFEFQVNNDFCCKKDECRAKVKPLPSNTRKRKAGVKKVSKVVVKEIKKACRDCGKISKLTKTKCCNNWICDDAHKYVMFSYALNSCYRNHDRYSNCSHHQRERHEGRWQECEICKDLVCGVCSDFDDVTCVSCGFKSERIEKFAFKINDDFYCKKDNCQKKCKEILDAIGWTSKRKIEDEEVKKAKKACRICDKASNLTKTKCCDSWVCDKYLSGFIIDACLSHHEKYSCCAFHHSQGHEGKVQDCEICKKRGGFNFDLNDFDLNFDEEIVDVKNIPENTYMCVSCNYKSETVEAFVLQPDGNYYCAKDECQKMGKLPLSKN